MKNKSIGAERLQQLAQARQKAIQLTSSPLVRLLEASLGAELATDANRIVARMARTDVDHTGPTNFPAYLSLRQTSGTFDNPGDRLGAPGINIRFSDQGRITITSRGGKETSPIDLSPHWLAGMPSSDGPAPTPQDRQAVAAAMRQTVQLAREIGMLPDSSAKASDGVYRYPRARITGRTLG